MIIGSGLGVPFHKKRGWSVRSLFANSEKGVWYDPSDFSTMYQDSVGTTAVTPVGQPYGNAHANIVPYQSFQASDAWFILAVGNDRQFEKMCAVIGNLELAHQARFASNAGRVENREAGMLIAMPHATIGGLPLVGSPLKLADTPVEYRYPPPRLGEHTEQILKELFH